MILSLEHLKYCYEDGFEALSDVNASISKKSFVVILGESGSGKTTLFKNITGAMQPQEGSIIINDKDVTKLTTGSRDLTMVFQDFVLYPHMNIYENVLTALNGFGLSNEEMDLRTKKILMEFGLGSYLNFKPRNLSDGQKQRVAMCKALVREPSIFLMDEPLSNLDLPQRIKIKEELKEIFNKYNSTFIYITHDLKDAEFLATEIWMMDGGRIVQIGTMDEIRKHPKTFKICYIVNSGNINDYQVHYENKKIVSPAFEFDYDGPDKIQDYTMCINYSDTKVDPNGPIVGILESKKILPEGILLTAILKDNSLLSCFISEDEDDEHDYKEREEIRFSFPHNSLFFYKPRN